MSYNGSGTFNINSTGQPVVAGTVITASAFNALTADLATGLTTAITKDGQTTTTARITFAQGITSSLVTDSSSVSTGSIITAGGAGIAKNLYVGGIASFSAQPIFTSLTASSAVATDASKGLVSVTNTGTGNNVLATSPTITTPTISSLSSASATALTLQSAGTTAVTIDTNSRVLIGSTSSVGNANANNLELTNPAGSGVCGLTLNVNSASANTGNIYWRSNASNNVIQIVGDPITNYFAVTTAGSERMRIDASGNVGIGTTSPQSTVGVNVALADTKGVVLQYNGEAKGGILLNPTAGEVRMGSINATGTYFTSLYSNNAEAMRIDTSGNLMVGGTSVRDGAKVSIDTSTNGMSIYVIPNTSAVDFAIFRANSGTLCGAISRVGTTGAVVYTATSDYRLKENIAPISGALAKVSTLNPVTFTWKDGGGNADGFIAHEFAEVCPNGVIGKKDGVDENGDPKYQAIDSSVAIPFLTAAIKELKALIDTQASTITALTARIVALESK
jgi:hypothetical protein